jgi:hypothetical protein
MDSHKIAIKLFVGTDTFAPAEFIPIFHRWIQTQALEGHLLIDVADYAHVPAGPGSLLVSSQANIHMDRGENRLGLVYVRKLPIDGATTFRDRLHGVLIETLKAAIKLEQEPDLAGRLKFRTDEIAIRIHDRLLAPNTTEMFDEIKPDIESVVGQFVGPKMTIEHHEASPLSLLEARVKTQETADVGTLLERAATRV